MPWASLVGLCWPWWLATLFSPSFSSPLSSSLLWGRLHTWTRIKHCPKDQPRKILPQHVGGPPGQLWHRLLHHHLSCDLNLSHQEEQAPPRRRQLRPLPWCPHQHLQVEEEMLLQLSNRAAWPIEIVSVTKWKGRASWQFLYLIYFPAIDTLITGKTWPRMISVTHCLDSFTLLLSKEALSPSVK